MTWKSLLPFWLGLGISLALAFPSASMAQGTFKVRVEYINNEQFPVVEAFVSVSDPNGLPLKDELADSAFSLTEDGVPVSASEIERFTNTEQSLGVALVVDTSTSMGSKETPTPLQKAVEAAKYFVEELADQDQVAVIKFSEGPEVVLDLIPAHDNKVTVALDSLQPEKNKTTLFDAIVKGVDVLETFSGRRIIVVVTDGKDTGTGLFDFESAMREATAASIPVYPMGFGSVINVQEMKRMAELTGGVAQIQPTALDLQASFATVLDILREQYRIQYISNLPADDTDHELIVAVDYLGGREQAPYHFLSKSSAIPVSISDFQSDQIIGGLVKFAPVIDWPAPLKSMQILMDGSEIASVDSVPFEYEWNSFNSNISPGAHDFVIKATDVAGNTGQAKISLNVQPPVTVEIIAPTRATVSGRVEIIARVTTLPGVSLSRVAFLVDDIEIASIPADPNSTEYKTTWDSGQYPAENHPVSVIAYDTNGLFTTEEKITVGVQVGNNSWMVILVVLALAALIIPVALRARRARQPAAVPGPLSGLTAGEGPALRELEGMNPNQTWPLGMSEVKLGRKRDENDIALKGLNASRRHASIRYENGQYVIYSLSANNPVMINNLPVAQKQMLRPGDVIRLGETVLRFEV